MDTKIDSVLGEGAARNWGLMDTTIGSMLGGSDAGN